MRERLAGSAAKRRTSSTWPGRQPSASVRSALVGLRPSSVSSWARILRRAVTWSPAWTGRRMVRPELAMPRVMAWRIHQVA